METNKQTQDDNTMADNILSCSSGEKEKLTAHAAWISEIRKAIVILTFFVTIFFSVTCFVIEKIKEKIAKNERNIAEIQTECQIRLDHLERALDDLKNIR